MEDKKKKILNILEWIITIAVLFFIVSWSYGIKVKVNDEGETVCYNIYNHIVNCR